MRCGLLGVPVTDATEEEPGCAVGSLGDSALEQVGHATVPLDLPSVDTEGEVRVDTPTVFLSETTEGAIRVQYDGWRLDGSIGDYPALAVYHDDPQGETTTLAQDAADNEGAFGPLLELPDHHDVRDGPSSDQVKEFGDLGRPISGPYYEYTPRNGEEPGGLDDPTRVEPWLPFGEEAAGTVA